MKVGHEIREVGSSQKATEIFCLRRKGGRRQKVDSSEVRPVGSGGDSNAWGLGARKKDQSTNRSGKLGARSIGLRSKKLVKKAKTFTVVGGEKEDPGVEFRRSPVENDNTTHYLIG